MGEMGLSFSAALHFPHNMVWPMWESNQRRIARHSLAWMDDAIAVSGLQGEMKEVGTAPKRATGNKTIPVGYQKHRDALMKKAYPTKRVWTLAMEKRAQDAFWGAVGDLPLLDLTSQEVEEDGGEQTDE